MVNAIDSPAVASSEHVHSGPAAKKAYTYVSPTLSWFFVNWWKPVYQWICPRFFPDWMHANVVTLLGAVYALGSFGILSYYSNYLTDKAAVPGWAFVVAGVLFWFYMTCDNCDGMQARRLGISSPVGELLDHGVDSLVISTAPRVVSFLFLGHTAAERLWWHSHSNTVFQFVFYASHAMSVMNGKVFMGFQWFSVDEMFILHGLFLVTAGVVGFEWMETPIVMPAGWLEWFTATFGVTFSKFTAIELFILCVYLFGAVSVTYTLANLAFDTYFAPGVPRGLALWKFSWWVFLRFGVLAAISNLSSPYNLVHMLTWTPMYSLMILGVVLRHMKDRPIRWMVSLALVSMTRYLWLPVLFNTPSFARSLPLGPWTDMMNGLSSGLEPFWAKWVPASLIDMTNNFNLDHATLAPSQGNEGLVAVGTMVVSWTLFLITVSSLLLRMRRDYHIPALFVVMPKTGEKIVMVEHTAGSVAPAHVAAEALEDSTDSAAEESASANEDQDEPESEEEEQPVRRRRGVRATPAARRTNRPRKSVL